MTIETKTCSKCHETKLLEEFYNQKSSKDGKRPECKKCKSEYDKEYDRNRKKEKAEYDKKYRREHSEQRKEQHKDWYKNVGRRRYGHTSMYENKSCAAYLGIVIGERLCKHLFKDVEVMPYGFPGYDIICNRGKKINVKSSCITLSNKKYLHWKFNISYNVTADFFILVAFDNTTNLNPLHMWMFPGKEINKQSGVSISSSTIHKWDDWKITIEEVQLCCAEMKNYK